MGASRRFKSKVRRGQASMGLKERNRRLAAYANDAKKEIEFLSAQLEATKRERPADLEDWINEVAIPDMSPEELAEWAALTPDEKEAFKEELGQRLALQDQLLSVPVEEPVQGE